MLVLVVATAVVVLTFVATVLAIAIAAMVVLVRRFVAVTVAAVMAMFSIAAFVAVVAIVAAVAVTIVTIVSIVQARSTAITTRRLRTAFAWFFGARFLGGILGFLLLELIEYTVRSIGVLALLEEANENDVIVGQSFMRLRILLLMLPRH